MVELVVAAQGRQGSHANTVGEEDLSRSVDPGLAVQQLRPVHVHVVPEAVERSWRRNWVPLEKFWDQLCTWQGEGTTEEDEHDKVGEEGGEPDNFSGRVESLGWKTFLQKLVYKFTHGKATFGGFGTFRDIFLLSQKEITFHMIR